MNRNNSKIVLVTGACGGIGKSIVIKYAQQGKTLAIADKDEEQSLKLAHEIQQNGGQACEENKLPCILLDNNEIFKIVTEKLKNF